MYAVVIRATIHDVQQASQILPVMKAMPGFVSGFWISMDDGKGLAIATFESMDSAQGMLNQWNLTPPGGNVLTVENVGFGEVLQRI